MRNRTHEALSSIADNLEKSLVSPDAILRMEEILCLVPDAIAAYYIECRLAPNTEQIDFLLCPATYQQKRQVFAQHKDCLGKNGVLLEGAAWQQVYNFSRSWADPMSSLSAHVPLIWLEFDDVGAAQSHCPIPSFSFCIDAEYEQKALHPSHVNKLNKQQYHDVAQSAFEVLFGEPLGQAYAKCLFTCFDALPPDGQIIHLSAMLARHPSVLKLYGSVPEEKFLEYLTHIGWTGSASALGEILETFCTPETGDHDIYFDLTVTDTVAPRIGIAFAQQQLPHLTDSDPCRRALLEKCVMRGLCTEKKSDALLAWPGSCAVTFAGHSRPTRFRKWLDVKLVYRPDCPLEAKGYLGYAPNRSLA